MRVLLVIPPRPRLTVLPAPDIGVAYVAQAARQAGAVVEVLDAHLEGFDTEQTIQAITRRRPDVVGFKCLTMDHDEVQRVAKGVKRALPSSVVVAGGPHPSALPELVLEGGAIDVLLAGEGEPGMQALVNCLKAGNSMAPLLAAESRVPGLVCRRNGKILRTPPGFVEDLEGLGFPAWDLFPLARYPVLPGSGGRFLPVLTSRGCPCSCRFCASPRLHGRVLRWRSIEGVIAEIRWLVDHFDLQTVSIFDDNFAANPDHAIRFCRAFRAARLPVPFDVPQGLRLDTLSDAVADALAMAGCRLIGLGLESGVQKSLDRMGKGLRVDQIEARVRRLKQRTGIPVNGFFILGFPHETMRDVWRTIRFALRLPLDYAAFTLFTPFPGTPVFDDMVAAGYFHPHQLPWSNLVLDRPVFAHPRISQITLKRLQTLAYLLFYLHPRRWRFFHRIFWQEASFLSYARRFLSIAGC